MSKLKIGIDIDNTIDASKTSVNFFSLFTNAIRHVAQIYIITNRDPGEDSRADTMSELDMFGIYYDELIITAEKSQHILQLGVDVYFDDTDEYFLDLPESVAVFKIREFGNFDFKEHKWLYGDKTGINIDKK
jgi:hypothetical protein